MLHFSVGRRAKQFGFCQRTSGPFVKSAFSSSIVTLQAASDEKLQNSKEKISRIIRQWNFNTCVEIGTYVLRRIIVETLLFKEVKPMSFVGISAKGSRTFGKVFRQGCELRIICAQRQFFINCFVFFSKQKVCSIELSEKDCLEVFRVSSHVYRGTFRRQRDSKRNMTVCFFAIN